MDGRDPSMTPLELKLFRSCQSRAASKLILGRIPAFAGMTGRGELCFGTGKGVSGLSPPPFAHSP